MSSSPPPESEPGQAQPEEAERGTAGGEDALDSTALQGNVDHGHTESKHNEGGEGYPVAEDGNAPGFAYVVAPGSAEVIEHAEISPPLAVKDLPQATGAGTSSGQQFFDADMNAKSSGQEEQYPRSQEDHGDGMYKELSNQDYQLDGAADSNPKSPAGFGIDDDGTSQRQGGAEGFNKDGGGGGRKEGDSTHSLNSQTPYERYPDFREGNTGERMGSTVSFGDGGGEAAVDESGSRRRIFDGSRLAEPDDSQIVDAGEGADVIPGVDDLPVFANDQSKALNDEIKVRGIGGNSTLTCVGDPAVTSRLCCLMETEPLPS